MAEEGFSLEYFPSLIFNNDTFEYLGVSHLYADVVSITYHALVIKRSTGFIHDGTDYQIHLELTFTSGKVVDIKQEPPKWGWEEKQRAEALMRASSILHEATFVRRMWSYIGELERKKYVSWDEYQFSTSGDLFKKHLFLFNLKSEDITKRLHPFALELNKSSSSMSEKISKLWRGNEAVELTQDRDCFLYFMKHYIGLSWENEHVKDKIVDQENAFLKSILILGAKVCKADGRVDSEEISTFKKIFGIDEGSFPGAANVFSNATKTADGVEDAARTILSIFEGQTDVLENLIVGLLQVAAADGLITSDESNLIRRVCITFRFSDSTIDRLFLIFAHMSEGNSSAGGTERTYSRIRTECLVILELSNDASQEEVKAAYRRLAAKHHPDALIAQGLPISRVKESEEIMKSINTAYNWLSKNQAV